MASALARVPLPPHEGAGSAASDGLSQRTLQQALLALDNDNRSLRRKLADAGAPAACVHAHASLGGLTPHRVLRRAEKRASALQAEKDNVGAEQAATLARREQAVRLLRIPICLKLCSNS